MTRHELKEQIQHDSFTEAVGAVVQYASSNRQLVLRWSLAVVVVLAIAGAAIWYNAHQRGIRQHDLNAALDIASAPIGTAGQFGRTFANESARRDASIKALQSVVAKYPGSKEGLVAQYYLGALKVGQDPKGAESDLRTVAGSNSECAVLAKVALAQLYASEHRMQEATTLLRSVVDKPTDLVSKTQAQVLLAQLEQTTNPQEAKKILQSVKTSDVDPAVGRAVDQLSAQLSQ